MKKSVIALLILIMVAFVSCDKPHEHQWKEEWKWDAVYDCEYHWHECADPNCSEVKKELHQWEKDVTVSDNRCRICGASVKVGVIGQIGVSKEHWDAALNMEKFPSVIKQHLYYPDKTDGFIYYSILEITEDTVYDYELDQTLTNKRFETCYVKENDSYWCYSLSSSADNKWISEKSSEDSYNGQKLKFVTIYGKGMAEFFHYEDFKLNLTGNEYTCDEVKIDFEGEELTIRNIVFAFEDNKLASYYFELVDDGACVCYKTTFSYNESDVNIPQYCE